MSETEDNRDQQTTGRRFGGGRFAGGMPAEKSRDFWGTMRRLSRLIGPDRVLVVILIAAGVIGAAGSVWLPMILASGTDTIVAGVTAGPGVGIDWGHLRALLILCIVVLIGSALFDWIQGYLLADVVQNAMHRLRGQVEDKINDLSLPYVDSQPRGDLLSRVTNDIDNLGQSMQQSMAQILNSVLTIVGVIIAMLLIDVVLGLLSLLIIPAAVIVVRVITRRSKVRYLDQWRHTGDLNAHVEESFTGHALTKVYNQTATSEADFAEKNEELYDSSYRAQFLAGLIQPFMMFLGNLDFVLVGLLGGLRVTSGQMSIGDIQAFVQYSRRFTRPLSMMASMANIIQSGIASAERVFDLLDVPEQAPDPEDPQTPTVAEGRVAFEHVWFSYDPEKPLIEDLSLEAWPGRTVAIVGPTGAGKTTLVNLLMRFYDIDRGAIVLDGTDTATMTRAALRTSTGMVLQDTWLFRGTIRENILFGNPEATEEQMLAAAKACYVDRFVHSLPDGYDTILSDDTGAVSAGEKQLITIARAFLADPLILILDEATSSVDTRTEVLIQNAMANLRSNRTSFVIAHRLSTIRDADVILVMENGQIVEQGNHTQLLEADGAYAELYAAQFAGVQT